MNILQRALQKITGRAGEVDLSGSKSLFGSIGSKSINYAGGFSFIPDGKGGVISIDGIDADASWLGLNSANMQYWAYNYCSPLAAVIDRLAEADTNGRIEFINEDKTTVKNPNKNPRLSRIKKLLANPNPWQTWEEFNSQQIVLCKIFGYCPVFCIGPTGMDKSFTKAMVNINPYFATYQSNYNFSLFEDENPIKLWRLNLLGKSYEIDSKDIILVKDGYIDSVSPQLGLPISKVAGLDYFVSNICAAMEADNVLLKKKGPLGVFSHDPKPDMAGWLPLTNEQKDDIQDDLKRYGLTAGQLQYVISKTPLKWNAMSFNLRDLMTKETVRQGIDGICDRFGYPAELMSGKNATYENRSSAEKFLYQNNIIPFSIRRMARYNKFFELDTQTLFIDYDHLPVLQEDIMHAGAARKSKSESLLIDWTAGLITWNEYRQLNDMDTIVGMDIYYNEYLIKFQPPKQETKNATSTELPKN